MSVVRILLKTSSQLEIGSDSERGLNSSMVTEFKMLDEVKAIGTQIMCLSKAVEDSSGHLKVLNTNIKDASISSNRNSRAMKYITWALVFLGFAQVVVVGMNYWIERSVIDAKKKCYQNVLQTSDIDLNYKSCLRNNGLSD